MGTFLNPRYKPTPAQQAMMYYSRKTNRSNVAVVNSTVAPAWGTILFPGNPNPGDNITIAGTVITFVLPSPAPSGAQVAIAATLALTMANVLAYLALNPIATANVTVTGGSAGAGGLLVQSVAPADTSVTLAASAATVSSANLVPNKVRKRLDINSLTVTP